MMCRLRAPFCWSCLLVAALFSKAAGQDAQATLHLSDPIETPLGTLPEDGFDSLKFSRDQLYVAWLDGTKWANRVSFNGKPGRAYRDIDDGKIAVSPDGRRVAYVADKGDMEVLVLDGREGRPYRYISGFSFSPDSRRHAYCAWETGAGNYAVVDGARHGPYDVMDGGSRVDPPHHRMYGAPQFTRDSRHVIYAAARTVQGRLQWRVVIDGKEGPTFDLGDSRNQVAIHVAALSPEPRFAHRAKKGEKWITVHNGVEGPEHDLVEWLAISPDGTRLAYFAKNGDEGAVYLDGVVVAKCDETYSDAMTFSPDGRRFAFIAGRGESWVAVVDGEPGPEYDGAHSITFSPDSQRVAYAASYGEHRATALVVVDGEEGPDHAEVAQLTFSPDSRRFAYRAKISDTEGVVVVDGEEYAAGGWWGREPACAVVFTPDSRHVAYFRVDDMFDRRLVIDDLWMGPSYAYPMARPHFSDGKIEYLVMVDWPFERVVRVSHTFMEPAPGGDAQ